MFYGSRFKSRLLFHLKKAIFDLGIPDPQNMSAVILVIIWYPFFVFNRFVRFFLNRCFWRLKFCEKKNKKPWSFCWRPPFLGCSTIRNKIKDKGHQRIPGKFCQDFDSWLFQGARLYDTINNVSVQYSVEIPLKITSNIATFPCVLDAKKKRRALIFGCLENCWSSEDPCKWSKHIILSNDARFFLLFLTPRNPGFASLDAWKKVKTYSPKWWWTDGDDFWWIERKRSPYIHKSK